MDKQKAIFKLFLYDHKLRFSDIEKRTGLRSNDVAYYVKRLVDADVLRKEDDLYTLTQSGESSLPFFQEQDIPSPLPVVLVGCFDKEGRVLLARREKRPYKGQWGLPGGRILLGETVEQAAKRIMKRKTFLDVNVGRIESVGNERVVSGDTVKHGFLLLYLRALPLTTIKEKESVRWFAPDELDATDIIESDYLLLTKKSGFFEFTCADE